MKAAALFLFLLLQAPSVSDQLAIRYSQWDDAYRRHDVKAQAAMLHPRFQIVNESGGVTSRADYVRSLWKSQPPSVYRTTLLGATRKGLRATATTSELSQKAGEEAHTHTYRDTWALVSGRWLLLESRTLKH